jgi:Mg2+-importing ATPase
MFRVLSFWLPMLPGFWCSRDALTRRREDCPAVTLRAWWAREASELLALVRSGPDGLSRAEAARRLAVYGRNELGARRPVSRRRAFANQLRNPLLGVLVFAAAVSALTGAWSDAAIVLAIVVATVGVGYVREYDAEAAAAALRVRVRTRVDVLRDGAVTAVDAAEVVPGDVVQLAAGSLVPADGILLDGTDCYVSEAVLTGESFPVAKRPGAAPPGAPLGARRNSLFLGTNVRSGFARMLVLGTGLQTEFGHIAQRLTQRAPDTAFDRGLLRFGYLLTTIMLVVVILVFLAHVVEGRPPIETLLFAVALAVGLSPELLPAVLRVNLARGARMMARHGVLVRHLNAIENLGSMDVLCTDKTGTLTEGVVRLAGAWDPHGAPSSAVLALAALNAALETGRHNPLDDAIEAAHRPDLGGRRKLAEIPFDFVRKRVGVVVTEGAAARLIVKGACRQVLEACDRLEDGTPLDDALRDALATRHRRWSEEGLRVLAVATRSVPASGGWSRDDEHELCFAGFLGFVDRPKPGVERTLAELRALGIEVKVITGDARAVSLYVARALGLDAPRVLSGTELDALNDEALWRAAELTDLFVEVDPNQKERIIRALRRMGHVVGFLGDGVNDAPAMHAADTSLSVEEAVDVAREAADFVLLERSLEAIRQGVLEGRRTFANTLKYVMTTTSANLGNMMSMALASLYLPFLPLLAGQILLNNFLSDVPAIGIADDNVDDEMIAAPRRWDLGFVARYMLAFGGLSSVFDLLTFATLLGVFAAPPEVFRTGWFIESLLTELLVALVVRTRRPCWKSRPGRLLLVSTLCLVPLALAAPWLPGAGPVGFVPLPTDLLASLAGITLLYVAAAEIMKRAFYRRGGTRDGPRPAAAPDPARVGSSP